jgi:dTDP-4-dehydrorhamnose 3,5-epimerase
MKVIPTGNPDVLLFEPRVFTDARGLFFEAFNRRLLAEHGVDFDFVQDNQSCSRRDVLRGLHYQVNRPQGKLVRVLSGEVFDVAVDCRRSSRFFGKAVHVTLSAENRKILWVPIGFAHGFAVLSDSAEVLYKTTDFYAPECERTIRWDDPDLGISWPVPRPILSDKDRAGVAFAQADLFE